uniref:Putative secreted protein n=1 Tax=Anopheles darlingi TaxID=43151 RepID=A0A2M4DHV0_ANODA
MLLLLLLLLSLRSKTLATLQSFEEKHTAGRRLERILWSIGSWHFPRARLREPEDRMPGQMMMLLLWAIHRR